MGGRLGGGEVTVSPVRSQGAGAKRAERSFDKAGVNCHTLFDNGKIILQFVVTLLQI